MTPSREQPTPMRPVLSVGRYSLFGEFATGGMATVHFGRMHSVGGFNKTVAIKRMRRDIGLDSEFVAMFLDEARLTSRIEHPNVVATIDVVAEAGEIFLVLEYVRGESLERLRKAARLRREHIPVPVAVSVVCGALAGLHAAHEAVGEDGRPLGIIHRDVSPQNILVGEDGVARISDFGIAKAESRLQVTQDGQMKGKLPYMAPEQLAGGANIDRRVDLFSSMTVLWELLAGRTLFRADHPGETIGKVLSAPVPSLCPLRPDVPPALDIVIRRGLSRPPDQRPPTAAALAALLEDSLGQGLASPRAVGAWVTSLAAEVLENRLRYVREMESISHVVARPIQSTGWTQGQAPDPHQAGAQAYAPPRPGGAPVPAQSAAAAVVWPRPDDSSLPSGSIRSFESASSTSARPDDMEAVLRGARSKRLALILGSAALVGTCMLVFLIATVVGSQDRSDTEAAAENVVAPGISSEPTVPPPLSAQPTVEQPAPPAPPTAEASAEASASASAPQPVKATGTVPTRPAPVKGVPTRPYLPDMP